MATSRRMKTDAEINRIAEDAAQSIVDDLALPYVSKVDSEANGAPTVSISNYINVEYPKARFEYADGIRRNVDFKYRVPVTAGDGIVFTLGTAKQFVTLSVPTAADTSESFTVSALTDGTTISFSPAQQYKYVTSTKREFNVLKLVNSGTTYSFRLGKETSTTFYYYCPTLSVHVELIKANTTATIKNN